MPGRGRDDRRYRDVSRDSFQEFEVAFFTGDTQGADQ